MAYEIERLVQQHPSCKGLAVVIGSQDKPDKRDKLNGVLKDVDKMVWPVKVCSAEVHQL